MWNFMVVGEAATLIPPTVFPAARECVTDQSAAAVTRKPLAELLLISQLSKSSPAIDVLFMTTPLTALQNQH
jgi:hypothetical protein